MKQRFFKLNGKDNYGSDINRDIPYPFNSNCISTGDVYLDITFIYGYTLKLWFDNTWVEEVFPTIYQVTNVSNLDSNIKVGDRFIKKEEEVIDQVFSSKTHLDNYDAVLDSKGERWMEETENLVGKRVFSTGATRNTDDGKLDFEGFLSPLVLKRYAEYMHNHRKLEDGSLRDSDNWQKGIPKDQYIKSLFRHFFDTWSNHRGLETKEDQQMNLCGVIFNSMGMLHELLKEEK